MSKQLDIERKELDTFPIKVRELTLDGNPVNLGNSDVEFRFEKNDGSVSIIVGINKTISGDVDFEPLADDFDEVGTFNYYIIVDDGDYETTYFDGKLYINKRL